MECSSFFLLYFLSYRPPAPALCTPELGYCLCVQSLSAPTHPACFLESPDTCGSRDGLTQTGLSKGF